MTPQRSTLAPFHTPAFRVLWSATLASNLGGLVQAVGAGWLMATLTSSHGMVALVQSSNTLPIMFFSLIAGAMADNFNRRRIMLAAQVFMALVSVTLAACAWAGMLTPWLLLAFTFLVGCGGALYNPSWQASMGDIVTREDLPAAVSLNSMGFNMMRSLGPAVGGLIVAVAGPAAAFALNAVSYLPLLGALARWKPVYPETTLPPERLTDAIGAGLRYVLMSPALLRVLGRGAVFGFGAVSVLALLPLVARDALGGTALTYGILLGAFGLGAIGGVALNAPLRARLANEHVVRLSFVGFALALAGLAWSPWLWASCALLMLSGACWVLALSLFNVTVQLAAPRWVVGRALSFYQMTTFGGMAAGAWSWGVLADAQGAPVALSAAAGLLLFGAVLGFWMRLAEFSTLDLSPAGLFRAPEPQLDITNRSGPMLILVEYEIDPEDTPKFLELMRDRRRIRLRDGARRWALLRDVETPRIWTESYHVATWLDYLRHNGRRTRADVGNLEALRALHRGPKGAFKVRRLIERQPVPVKRETTPRAPSPELPGL